jgi:uncharacterized protein
MIDRIDVEFPATDGTKLAAWLFRPADRSKPLPAVTMAHGFSATRFHGIEPLARAFAEAGFVVLLHDHRNFGGSGGEPRHDIDPWCQIEEWRQAISYLESLDYVDSGRIGLWGTSFSGGHAIVLGATDRRVKAVVTQVPTIDGFASGPPSTNPNIVKVGEGRVEEGIALWRTHLKIRRHNRIRSTSLCAISSFVRSAIEIVINSASA